MQTMHVTLELPVDKQRVIKILEFSRIFEICHVIFLLQKIYLGIWTIFTLRLRV